MTRDFARSIGDGYPEYVDDELGYNYHAWEVISAAESRRHERIRMAGSTELKELERQFEPLSDPERWALARRHLELGQRPQYFELLEPIVDGPLEHPALHYPEIFVDLARRHAEDGEQERAEQRIELIGETWPEFEEAIPLLSAQLQLFAGHVDKAHEAFVDALQPHDDDVDLLIETALDFEDAGALDKAHHWLDRARQAAIDQDDRASLVDIDLTMNALPEVTEEQTEPESPPDRP